MIKETYQQYTSLGLHVIPIEWDTAANGPKYHPKDWQNADVKPKGIHNGLMIHTSGEWGCIDFDLKNTDKKDTFDRWMQHIQATHEDILSKVFIESTRSGGYHVFIRYGNLPKKTEWAQGPTGQEVIALYANGPLIYTYPTPGYIEVHQSMEDVEPLTDAEFNFLVEVSRSFRRVSHYPG